MTYEDYLQHWGILGMKWGQRNGPPYPLSGSQMNSAERRQNKPKRAKDMSTEELDDAIERTRKLKELKEAQRDLKRSEKAERRESQDIDTRKLLKKNPKKMTDEELQIANNRANLEKSLKAYNESNVKNGRNFVGALLATGATVGLTTMVAKIAKNWGDTRGQSLWENVIDKKNTRRKAAEAAKYTKDFEKARLKAFELANPEGKKLSPEQYSNFVNDVQKYVNFFMINQGYDKPYKKDK